MKPSIKPRFLALAGAAAFASSLSAIAGPDWTVIERARAAAIQSKQHQNQKPSQFSGSATASGTPQKAA